MQRCPPLLVRQAPAMDSDANKSRHTYPCHLRYQRRPLRPWSSRSSPIRFYDHDAELHNSHYYDENENDNRVTGSQLCCALTFERRATLLDLTLNVNVCPVTVSRNEMVDPMVALLSANRVIEIGEPTDESLS
jgi:hypothetical protein